MEASLTIFVTATMTSWDLFRSQDFILPTRCTNAPNYATQYNMSQLQLTISKPLPAIACGDVWGHGVYSKSESDTKLSHICQLCPDRTPSISVAVWSQHQSHTLWEDQLQSQTLPSAHWWFRSWESSQRLYIPEVISVTSFYADSELACWLQS